MIRHIRKVDTSWTSSGFYSALSAFYLAYIQREETEPSVLYCTSDIGSLYPHVVCLFAIKSGLRLKFIPKADKTYFYYGD